MQKIYCYVDESGQDTKGRKAVLNKTADPYQATILVDGLGKTERFRFAAGLRKLKVKVHKVRGINDKNDSLTRLADAVVGFIRDCMEGDFDMENLYKKSEEKKTIQEI